MMKDGSMKNRETSDGNGTSWNASDGENAYYARVLAEVERLQPVGAGDGILVLNLMYPCFETGARIGMGLSVRSGKDVFPVDRGRSADRIRIGISTVRYVRLAVGFPVAVFLWWLLLACLMGSRD